MNLKLSLAAAVGFVALVVAVLAYNKQLPPPLSGAAGSDFTFPVTFWQGATIGGRVVATSSQGTATYTAANLIDATLIQHTAAAAVTVTLPASSTLSSAFAPRAGDTRTIFINAITSNVTLAGGTGTDLNTASSTKTVVAGGMARLDFVRKANSDFEVLITTGI